MKYYRLIVFLLLSQMGFSQETTTKNLGDFDAVKVFDKISLQLIPSEESKIELSGKNSSEVEIVNNNGELKVRMQIGKFLSGEDVTALVYYKKIQSLDACEGSYISSDQVIKQISFSLNAKEGAEIKLKLEVQKLSIRATSGGIINLEGMAKNQDIIISSGGVLNAKDFQTEQTNVAISAGGTADVRASELVDAKVRAGGTITIFGKPKQINQKTVLGGSINQSNR
ncbi:Putative auto-transporter adhesin, head GIN domain containing protein [Flavobacteriaceae bacterium]